MKKLILLIALSFSGALLSMEKTKNDIGEFIELFDAFRDMSLTCERVRTFFLNSKVTQDTIELFSSSDQAKSIVQSCTTAASNKGDLATYEIETFYAGLLLVAKCEKDTQKRGQILSTAYSLLRNAESHFIAQVDAILQASALRSTGENALNRALDTLDDIKKLLDFQKTALKEHLEKITSENK